MTFDIIILTQEEIDALSVIQLKLLRTAQKKKNELYKKKEEEKRAYRLLRASDNAVHSTLYADKCAAIDAEYDYEVDILREQLDFNMSLNEPTVDDELGGNPDTGDSPYIVDYGLSYLERYNIVRDYYLTVEDPEERLALYRADGVAVKYLGGYYNTLYNYFSQLAGVG